MGRWRRRIFRGGIAAAAVVVVVATTLPWWLPHAIALAGPSFGIHVGDWTHDGWATIEYRDLVYERDGLRVNIASARLPLLLKWPASKTQPSVVARDITITPMPSTKPRPPGAPPPSTRSIVRDVSRAWPQIQRWLPPARLEHVTIAAGAEPIRLERVDWDGATARVAGPIPGRAETANLSLSVVPGKSLQLHAEVPAREARLDATGSLDSDRLAVTASLDWLGNDATATAQFAEGFLPREATLDAPAVTFPAEMFGLAGYGPVQGILHGEWTDAAFVARIDANAAPVDAGDNRHPPLAVEVGASGDASHARVDTALVRVPGIVATLSAPLEIALPAGTPAGPGAFTVEIDLAKIPWISAAGKLSGRVDASGGPAVAPVVRFALSGQGVQWRDATIANAELAGSWQPQLLKLDRCDLQFDDASRANASLEIDLAKKNINAARVSAHVASAAVRAWLPSLPQFQDLTIDAHASGALAQPTHEGSVKWSGLAGAPGGAIDGALSWKGDGLAHIGIEGSATSAAGVTIPLKAQLTHDAVSGSFSADVSDLSWSDAQGEWWRLAQPARLEIVPARDGTPLHARIAGLKLAGEGVALSVDADARWPASGELTAEVSGLDGSRLAAFIPKAVDAARIETLRVHAQWNDGPVSFDGAARATYAADATADYAIETAFRTESDTLVFGSVRVLGADGVVLQGEGRLPFTMSGTQRDGFRIAMPSDGALSLTLHSTPNPKFWESLARLTGWQATDPQLEAQISGSLRAPRGTIDFTAGGIVPPSGAGSGRQLPHFTDLHFLLTADDDGVAMNEGRVAVDGNWVGLDGRAPWEMWRDWRAGKGLLWRKAEFSFGADRLPMAIGARAMPTLLADEGDVSFSLKHEPGRGFTGFFYLSGASLRPIAPLGALRNIEGDLRMNGYNVALPHLGALLGGRPIDISGSGSIASADHPEFDLHLVSGHVPLVREQGLVLRAGLDLRVEQHADKPAHISGSIDLGQSVLVSDLVALIPTGGAVAAPERRPPYFSVNEDPFASWTLNVAMHGDDFLRIENPFFQGTISADFKLEGTLAEPRAVGRAWSDQGVVIFPFGSMRLDQLELTLSPENPYEPVLLATGSTRLFGYDVRMEASGSASDPRLLFNSDPPLSSQALFLMLTTGELPETTHTFSTSERAQRLAMFVGRNLATTLGITAGSGGGGEEKLSVRSGEDFSREGGETIYVQYNLNGRWSLVGERDRFDAYNGGIKFRLIDR